MRPYASQNKTVCGLVGKGGRRVRLERDTVASWETKGPRPGGCCWEENMCRQAWEAKELG